MDDHELRQLRIECVNELKSFVSFFNIGGVDHTHGGFCCGLSHAGKRLTDQKFVWFNGRGVWTYARLHRSGLLAHEPAPPHDDVHSDGMQGYLLQVAARAAAFAIEHGRDEAGACRRLVAHLRSAANENMITCRIIEVENTIETD